MGRFLAVLALTCGAAIDAAPLSSAVPKIPSGAAVNRWFVILLQLEVVLIAKHFVLSFSVTSLDARVFLGSYYSNANEFPGKFIQVIDLCNFLIATAA